MNANDLYDMFANQANPNELAAQSVEEIAKLLRQLDADAVITDYTSAARGIKKIAKNLSR